MLLNSVGLKEETEVVIISVDGNDLERITVEDGTSSDQLNVKTTAADVEEDLVQLGKGDGVDRTESIMRLLEFTNGVS